MFMQVLFGNCLSDDCLGILLHWHCDCTGVTLVNLVDVDVLISPKINHGCW